MFRKPVVWVAFTVIAAACTLYSLVAFPRAFPLVSLDLQMDRGAALESARRLAEKHGWGPEGFRQAASFGLDDDVRNFVELEAGGRDGYIDMLGGGLYSPYTWRVRHFKPGETNETRVRFTPSGEPYGFREQLSEDEPGASLESDEALPIAEAAATEDWRIVIDDYELVERRQDIRPGGRTDHTFVYERPDVQVGEGRYRLRLVVGGDRLTELTHLVKVPEAFDRRFQEMRSANNAIAIAAMVGMAVLLVGGAIVGLFFLLRERWVLWRQPLLWAGIVSFGMALLTLNQWPLMWMDYDTAVSSTNFLLQRIAMLIGQFLGLGLLYVLAFMAAECLTRRAFPEQIQFWKSWSTPVASSPALLGRTAAGYLLVAIDLAFLVLFYSFAFEKLGWWSPSEALLDPNILATPFPWLVSIAISLQAGFWEECMFRAVPLAGAALLGKRFGGKTYWIIGALIVQALLFGGGHADYPGHPSYARVVELFLPAVFWGVIYLAFGLIPVIVLHFAFDVALISIPLWVSSSSGLWDDRVLVVVLALVPLWVVLARRWRQGRWGPVGEESLNRSWTPPPAPMPAGVVIAGKQLGITGLRRNALWALGAVGAVAWFVLLQAPADAPPLNVGRGEAIAAADAALAERGLTPPESFRPLAHVEADPAQSHRFIWQEGDTELYRELLGSYLPEPRWRVRYATFEGDVAARAEEFQVWVDGTGAVTRVRHQLPQAAEGADLEEGEARERARQALNGAYGVNPETMKEVKASPTKEENRTDWRFEYTDEDRLPLEKGEARIGAALSGDEVTETFRYVHIPEEWGRNERNRETLTRAVQVSSLVLSFGLFLAGAVIAIIRWSRQDFGVRVFVTFALLLVAIRSVVLLTSWPAASAQFQTAVPFKLQGAIFVAIGLLVALVSSVVVALNLGLIERWRPAPAEGRGWSALVSGAALGLLLAGIAAAIIAFAPQSTPRWADYGPAGNAVPWIAAMLGPVSSFVTTATLLLLVFVTVDRRTGGWTHGRVLAAILLLPVGLMIAGMQSVESLTTWLAAGVLVAVVMWGAYVWVLRFDLSLVPVTVGAFALMDSVKGGLAGAFPNALLGSVLAAILVAILAIYWHRLMAREVEVSANV